MSDGVTLDFNVHFTTGRAGQRVLNAGERPPPAAIPEGRVPRISRLMALAIRFDNLARLGEVADFADIAELGQVTRARVSQIVNLLNLAPDIQEDILFLAPVAGDRAGGPIHRRGAGLGAAKAPLAETSGGLIPPRAVPINLVIGTPFRPE